ncbi:hypothetical protein CTAYLR_001000 [Chrysophaeum taylorii]|uniref:PH domain-containing protein n=1 Tax=Chrysophaeum taylorii TaxID=2483200 RepID=A0AAD7UFI8_9STRA|nr:hypothetical protein CTAYLR_001000 [Chrysophaeum taylorii]
MMLRRRKVEDEEEDEEEEELKVDMQHPRESILVTTPSLASRRGIDPKELRGETRRTLALDGFLHRKTRYGAWKERYFRTEGPYLLYYTTSLNEIKARRFDARKKKLGPYEYDSTGKAYSEMFDLRSPGTDISYGAHGALIVLCLGGAKKIEVKADSEADARRWVETLEKIRAFNEARKQRIGTFCVEIDGAYVVGPKVIHRCECTINGPEASETSSASRVEGIDDVAYENLDESLEAVSRAPDVKLRAEIPVYQASSVFRVTIRSLTEERQRNSLQGPVAISSSEGVASRDVSLFELQEEQAEVFFQGMGESKAKHGDHGNPASALEAEAEGQVVWPSKAPDGSSPAPGGFRWLALFEEDSSPEDQAPRVRGLVHCRLRYWEHVVQTIDLVGAHDRYEADDDSDLTEFKLDLLSGGMKRLEAVYEDMSAAGDAVMRLLQWERPLLSLACWVFLTTAVATMPDASTLVVFPLFALVGICFTLPHAISNRQFQVEGDQQFAKAADETHRRDIAEISLAVVAARDLVAPDSSFFVSTDPYAVVVQEPPPSKKLPQMLVGLTSVKNGTLSPEWVPGAPEKKNYDDDDDDGGGGGYAFSSSCSPSRPPEEGSSPVAVDQNEALKMVVGAHLSERILNDVLPEEPGGRNAVTLSESATKDFGDGAVVKPPVDFRSRWRVSSTLLSPATASWTWPILQEQIGHSLVPWHDAKGRVLIEIYDRDVASDDTFLGCCRIPIAKLFSYQHHLDEWFQLERYPDGDISSSDKNNNKATTSKKTAKKNAAIDASTAANFGSVRICARARVVDSASSLDLSPPSEKHRHHSSWQHAQAIRRSILEPEIRIRDDKKAGYVGQYKDVARSLKSMQDSVLMLATYLERFVALCTWVHPAKTLFVAFGLAAAVLLCLVIPNRVLVASLVAKLFLNGLFLKLRGQDNSEVPFKDPTYTQISNLLSSLPNATQRAAAYKIKRDVWTSQFKRHEKAVRISLQFAFRVRCQIHACIISKTSTLAGFTSAPTYGAIDESTRSTAADSARARRRPQQAVENKKWTYVYVVVVDAMVIIWQNVSAAADNKKPLLSLHIAGPPLVDEPPPSTWPDRPRGLTLVSLASRLPRASKIKDFYLALAPYDVETFAAAVHFEILDSANCRDHHKPTTHHFWRRSAPFFHPWQHQHHQH